MPRLPLLCLAMLVACAGRCDGEAQMQRKYTILLEPVEERG